MSEQEEPLTVDKVLEQSGIQKATFTDAGTAHGAYYKMLVEAEVPAETIDTMMKVMCDRYFSFVFGRPTPNPLAFLMGGDDD